MSIETITTKGTYQNDATPDCPICGTVVARDETDGQHTGCHHFIGVYNGWYDDDDYEQDHEQVATHMVTIQHQTAGISQWYFETSELDKVMTAAEVADIYGIANATVRQTIARGAIRARKSGSTWLILRSDAERFWNRNATRGVTTWMLTVLAVLAIVSQL